MRPLYRNIIVTVLALMVFGAIASVVWLQTKKSAQSNQNSNVNTVVNTNTTTSVNTAVNTNTNTPDIQNTNTGTITPVTDQSDRQSLVRLSKLLVDRYGTYSNRNNFENITGLEAYMTESFKKSSAEFISKRQAEGVPETYYSIVTTSLVADVTAYTKDKSATVDVATRRVETTTGTEQKVFTQHALVTFQSVAGNWKVSAIDWK